jgi:hypothetical protein
VRDDGIEAFVEALLNYRSLKQFRVTPEETLDLWAAIALRAGGRFSSVPSPSSSSDSIVSSSWTPIGGTSVAE